jgi:hypothetical protein
MLQSSMLTEGAWRKEMRNGLVAVSELVIRAEHVSDLLLVHVCHVSTSDLAILTRIEVLRMQSEGLTDTSSVSQTRVRVDVDLADSALSSLAELILWDTNSVGELPSIFVDDVDILLRNRRRAVKNDWEARELLLDLCQHVECQWRRNQTACLRVTCALLGLELVSTVRSTDGDSQRVATRTLAELDDLLRTCIVRLFSRNLILNTSEDTQLCLHSYVELVSVVYALLGQLDVLIERLRRSVDHDRREAHVYAALHQLEAVTVVEVQHDLRMVATQRLSILHSALCHVAEKDRISIVAGTLRHLKDHRRAKLRRGCDDSLELLEVIEVECWDSITASDGSLEHLACVDETKIFVINCHNT